MRVALIAPFHQFGGSEHQILLLQRGLRAQGVETLLCHLHTDSPELLRQLEAMSEGDHVEVKLRSVRNPCVLGADAWALGRLLRARGCQIVHGWNYSGHILGGIGARLARVPCVFSVGGLDPWKRSWQLPLYQALNRLADAIAFQSESERDAVCRRERIAPARTRIIPNGVDRARFESGSHAAARRRLRDEFGIPEDVPTILSVGSLRPIKGHDVLIEAVRRIRAGQPDLAFHAVIAGEGPLGELYRRKSQGLPVTLAGFRGDVEWLYRAADVYCQPSRSEGLPNAVIEAMCGGLPVVAADVGGTRELVGPENGVLFPAEDAQALAAALGRMAADRSLWRAMGAASRARAARFSDAAMANAYAQLYREVAAARGGGRAR